MISLKTYCEETAKLTGKELVFSFHEFLWEAFLNNKLEQELERLFSEYKDDVTKETECSLVLNWGIWYFHDVGDDKTAKKFDNAWAKFDSYVMDNWKGDDLTYYIRETD